MRMLNRVPILALIAVAACGGQQQVVEDARPEAPGLAPTLVLERFLRAANQNDLETMAQLFGTADGSILRRDPRTDVEERMFAIASLLRHEDFELVGEGIVPGRRDSAVRLLIRLHLPEDQVTVPFTMVRSNRAGWLVERIDVEAITGRP